MTPVGNGSMVIINNVTYCFETVSFFVKSRADATALIGGGVYRAASAASSFGIKLRTRLHHENTAAYVTLLKNLAAARTTVTIEDTAYSKLVLTSGSVTSEENRQYAVCEIEFTEVDN